MKTAYGVLLGLLLSFAANSYAGRGIENTRSTTLYSS
jgi:hypothetical protein